MFPPSIILFYNIKCKMSNKCLNFILTQTNICNKLILKRGSDMLKRLIENYGVLILFYLFIILSVILINNRFAGM